MENQSASVSPTSPVVDHLPGPIALLKEAWSIYRNHVKPLILISLFSILAYAIPFALILGSIIFVVTKGSEGETAGLEYLIVPLAIIFFFFLVFSQIVFGWAQLAMIHLAGEEALTWKQALGRSKGQLRSYIWVIFLTGLIVMGGFMLLIIPGILFSLWFMLSTYVVALENKKGMEALLISREYVRGKFWAVFWRFFVFAITSFLIGVVISMIAGIFEGDESVKYAAPVINILLNIAQFFVFTPLSVVYGFVLYQHLKTLKGPVSVTVTRGIKMKYLALVIIGLLSPIAIVAIIAASTLYFWSPPVSSDALILPEMQESEMQYDVDTAI